MAFAKLAEMQLPDDMPENWCKLFERVSGEKAPKALRDSEGKVGIEPTVYVEKLLKELREIIPMLRG